MSGSTTASLAASGGNLTLDASASVLVGGTSATLVALGRAGQTTQFPALAGGGTQFVQVTNTGAVQGSGVAVTSLSPLATAALLEDASSASTASSVPIRNLAATLGFNRANAVPASFTRTESTYNAVYEVLPVVLQLDGPGEVGNGPQITLYGWSGGEAPVEAGAFATVMTNIGGSHAAYLRLSAATAGALQPVCEWATGSSGLKLIYYTSAGALVVDGSGVVTSTGYTPASAAIIITAGAGLTGGGDLSANRTIAVAAADASITVNADSIEASGDFVAKNITTTGSITGSIFAGAEFTPTTLKVAADSPVTAAFRDLVRVDPAAGAITVNLPTPNAGNAGKVIWVFNEGTSTNVITVTTPSGTINSAASKTITTGWGWMYLICTGNNGYLAMAGTGP
jgi:hypothetical protein